MPEEFVISQCSPTMAGLKTGNLFSCPAEDCETLRDSIRRMNAVLVPRGARILPVKRMRDRVLCYMYRPEKLKKDLAGELAQSILAARAYPVGNTERCVAELCRRLQQDAAFPHEVGLFLGYPPEDVAGFIENGSHGAKCVGAWKVYGDEKQARKTFRRYAACTRAYRRAYGRRAALEELICTDHPGNGADRARTVRR